jgi:hypothetical protein
MSSVLVGHAHDCDGAIGYPINGTRLVGATRTTARAAVVVIRRDARPAADARLSPAAPVREDRPGVGGGRGVSGGTAGAQQKGQDGGVGVSPAHGIDTTLDAPGKSRKPPTVAVAGDAASGSSGRQGVASTRRRKGGKP